MATIVLSMLVIIMLSVYLQIIFAGLALAFNIINLFVKNEKSARDIFVANCIIFVFSSLLIYFGFRNKGNPMFSYNNYNIYSILLSLAGMLYYLFMQRKNKFLFASKKESAEAKEERK